jgi:Icc-related predicted phosphoesterase
MDPPLLDHTISALGVSLNGRGVVLGDVGFCGVSASPVSILKTPNEIPEDEILRRAEAGWKEISDARWRLFVPHAPPHGTPLDRTFMGLHVGSTAVRKFVELRQPDAVICGHIHEARGITTLGKSTIINCGPAGKGCYGIVDIMETVHVELRPQRKGHDRTP